MGYNTVYHLDVVGSSTVPFSGSDELTKPERKALYNDPDYDKFHRYMESLKDFKGASGTADSFKIRDFEVDDIRRTHIEIPVEWLYHIWTEGDSCKWYRHEIDMKAFSTLFPNLIFRLTGEGEDPGDIWKKYFKDGKVQVCHAKITYDPFDEGKLK